MWLETYLCGDDIIRYAAMLDGHVILYAMLDFHYQINLGLLKFKENNSIVATLNIWLLPSYFSLLSYCFKRIEN